VRAARKVITRERSRRRKGEAALTWRERLCAVVQRSGMKRGALARNAGIAPESLSRVLNGHRPNVSL
jgi:predicted transcriptional regulator